MTHQDPHTWRITLTTGDPLHAEMQAYMQAIQVRGRYSPVPGILARWAGMGYLIEVGRIPTGGGASPSALFDALEAAGLLAVTATPEAIAEALATIDGTARPAGRPRLALVEVQREREAIAASAAGMDFE